MNSLELYKFEKVFDLIWVDGAHGYPYGNRHYKQLKTFK